MRKSFSAVRSGLGCIPILARRTFKSWDANGCTSADENLQNLTIRSSGGGGKHKDKAYMSVGEPPTRMDRMRSSATAAYVYTTTSCDSRQFRSSGITETSCSFVSYRCTDKHARSKESFFF